MNLLNLRSLALVAALLSVHNLKAQETPEIDPMTAQEEAPILESATPKQNALTLLSGFTLGNNPFYSKVLSPAKSIDMNKSDADRTAEINKKIAGEIEAVLTAFNGATEDSKAESVSAVTKQFDSHIAGTAAAQIQFIDGTPSAAIARTLVLIDKTGNEATLNPKSVMDSMTSYKRSTKPSDFSYEYPSADNLTTGPIKSSEGSDASWVKPGASPEFLKDQDYAIKKCRQIFGWRCVTTLYHVGEATLGNEKAQYLFMGNYNIKDNPDNAEFGGDKRTTNQVAGSSALFVVKESAKWILIYGVDAQWNRAKIQFGSLIQDEYQKDFGRMNQRIAMDLKQSKTKSEDAQLEMTSKPKKKRKSHGPRS